MFFKVVHNKQVHIYNPKEKFSFVALQQYIKEVFKRLPQKYQLYYIDEENDQITLANQHDFLIMAESSNKSVKIYIKEVNEDFYDQTQKIVLDDEPEKEQLKPQDQEIESDTDSDSNLTSTELLPKEPEQKEQSKIVIQKSQCEHEDINQIEKIFIEEQKFKSNWEGNQDIQEINFKEQSFIREDKMNDSDYYCDSQVSQVSQAMIERKIHQMLPGMIEKVKEEVLKESICSSQIRQGNPEKSFFKQSKPIHKHIICDNCQKKNIEGVRYKCSVCQNFDLCEDCEANFEHPHCFLKIRRPEMTPLKIITIMDDQENSLEVNGYRFPFPNLQNLGGFFGNMFGGCQQANQNNRQGFQQQQQPRYCPYFNKGQNKTEFKKQEKVQEQKSEKQVKVEQKKQVRKPQVKKEEPKVDLGARFMENANYISEILGKDYNSCFKYAQKYEKLTKEQLLEKFFSDPISM